MMEQFLKEYAEKAQDAMFLKYTPPLDPLHCKLCKTPADDSPMSPGLFRCTRCINPPLLCKSCMLSTHAHTPLHLIDEWDRDLMIWHRRSLYNIGHVIYLGHDGERCEEAIQPPRVMTIVHERGIHSARVGFCRCGPARNAKDPAAGDAAQLIAAGFWPGSWSQPATAYTMDAMRLFHIAANQAHLNAQEYTNCLKRLTDNVDPSTVPVRPTPPQTHPLADPHGKDRHRELLTAARQYNYMQQTKHCGVKPSVMHKPGSLAVLCPPCPHPGINMDPGWEDRPEDHR